MYISKVGLRVHRFGLLVSKLTRLFESCGGDKMKELGGKVHDISVHERSLDALLDLYRQDQLDNAVQLDTLSEFVCNLCSSLQVETPAFDWSM